MNVKLCTGNVEMLVVFPPRGIQCTIILASFPGLPCFYLPFVFTIVSDGHEVDISVGGGGGGAQNNTLDQPF